MLLLTALLACSPSEKDGDEPWTGDESDSDTDSDADTDTDTDTDADTDTDTDTDSDSDSDSDSDADTDTDTDTDADVVFYDCDELPDGNLGDQTLDYARAYHGLTFDDEGNLIGWDGMSAIVKSRMDDESRTAWLPGYSYVQQMDRLPDGDFVWYDAMASELERVSSDGGVTIITSAYYGVYGVTVGPDGKVWIANGNVYRIDPDTGDSEDVLVRGAGGFGAHSLNFNLDSTRLYIGTMSGQFFYVDLDADLNPTTTPTPLSSSFGTGWHDAIGVDTCGNLYVADYQTSGLYRVSADGSTVTSMYTGANSMLYGHGLAWGSGVDGWREDALYLPEPYNGSKVREIIIGVANGDSVRTWNGTAVPW